MQTISILKLISAASFAFIYQNNLYFSWHRSTAHDEYGSWEQRTQNGRFQEVTGGQELSSENGRLPFKTGELEHIKKAQTDQSIQNVFFFLLFWKEMTHKPKWQLRLMFFILCYNWKTLPFIKDYRCSEIFLTAMLLLSLKPVL